MKSKTITRTRRRQRRRERDIVDVESLFASSKLSPESINFLSDRISKGVPINVAVEGAGISEKTFYNWMNEAKEVVEWVLEEADSDRKRSEVIRALPERQYLLLQFLQSIKRARLNAMEQHVGNIQAAGRKNWQASAWYLERRYPEEFGRQTPTMTQANKVILPRSIEELRRDMPDSALISATKKAIEINRWHGNHDNADRLEGNLRKSGVDCSDINQKSQPTR